MFYIPSYAFKTETYFLCLKICVHIKDCLAFKEKRLSDLNIECKTNKKIITKLLFRFEHYIHEHYIEHDKITI